MADPNSDDCNPPLSFVACVSDEEILRANLLASPCLKPGSAHELILVKNCENAADGLNRGIARARHERVVCLHQDVHLPPGWDERLFQQLNSATRQWGPIGVAGVYGVGDPTEVHPESPSPAAKSRATGTLPEPHPNRFAVKRIGRVIHRGQPALRLPTYQPAYRRWMSCCSSRSGNTPLRFDPALGFHLYGADICLQAQERGLYGPRAQRRLPPQHTHHCPSQGVLESAPVSSPINGTTACPWLLHASSSTSRNAPGYLVARCRTGELEQ